MVKVCINGGSVAGLSTALLLAADGHDVTVAERDPAPPSREPRESWEAWDRRSVRQFRQSHAFLPRFRRVLVDELPHVWTRLLEAGAVEYDLVGNPPPTVGDIGPRQAGDDVSSCWRLDGARSSTCCADAADDDPRIDLRSGVVSEGLVTGDDQRVRGLATNGGMLTGDVVVDCSGARTSVPGWVEEAGGRRPSEETTEFRIAYWTQWFRLRPGRELPPIDGLPAVTIGSAQLLRVMADDGWFSITVVAPASERKFRVLADQETLLRLLRSRAETRAWTDPELADPVGGILPMFTPLDSRRRYVVEGQPCLTGIAGVGDAIGATNPAKARGCTFAAMHAVGLRDVLRTVDGPSEVTEAHDAWLNQHFERWWRETVEPDRADLERMRAVAQGDTAPPTDPGALFRHAAAHDPVLWRHLLRILGVFAHPGDVMADPAVGERLGETLARVGPPRPTTSTWTLPWRRRERLCHTPDGHTDEPHWVPWPRTCWEPNCRAARSIP